MKWAALCACGWAMMTTAKASELLDSWCATTVRGAVSRFGAKGLAEDEIAMTVARWRGTASPEWGAASGSRLFYPASVCKLFFLAYGAHQIDQGELRLSPEADRAFTDMIVESDNDATGAAVDLITRTTSGPELSLSELDAWFERRLQPTNWFLARGYKGVYVPQKTYYSGPYGRERQGRGPNGERANRLCTDATARLMAEILRGEIASPDQTRWMLTKLARPNPAEGPTKDSQAAEFIGKAIPKGAKLWSKAGWTSTTRHDVAAIQLANGETWVICVFTQGSENANNQEIIPWVAGEILRLAATGS